MYLSDYFFTILFYITYYIMKLIKVEKSNKPNKKFVAIFKKENGKEKKVHFGAEGMRDFTLINDKNSKFYIKEKEKRLKVRENYQRRHKKDLLTEKNKRGEGAGSLSYYLLWTTPKMNVAEYKRRFNL